MMIRAVADNKPPALTGPTQEKWGAAALGGFQTVPDLLLRHQNTLKITSAEMVVLLNVLMHWWYRDQMPFPRPTTIRGAWTRPCAPFNGRS